jgi:hypothetical protein
MCSILTRCSELIQMSIFSAQLFNSALHVEAISAPSSAFPLTMRQSSLGSLFRQRFSSGDSGSLPPISDTLVLALSLVLPVVPRVSLSNLEKRIYCGDAIPVRFSGEHTSLR